MQRNHRCSPLLARSSFPFSLPCKFTSRASSNPKINRNNLVKSPMLIDSCKLITKSRDEILGLTVPDRLQAKHQNNPLKPNQSKAHVLHKIEEETKHALRESITKPKHISTTESNKISFPTYHGKVSGEENGRLTETELSENVIYGRGGIGFSNANISSINNEYVDLNNHFKQEIINRRSMYKKFQRESLETIKSLETAREDSSEVEESSAQVVYTQPVEEIWPRKSLFPNDSRVRVKTKPDKDKQTKAMAKVSPKYLDEDIENDSPSRISKPYIGNKISTKSEIANKRCQTIT